MRVGIFLPKALRPYSIDFEGCAAEMLRQGHEPVVVCPANEHPDFPCPVIVHGADEAASPGFWKTLGLDRVICLTWFRHPEIFRAIREAGAQIINRADSDGLVSARVFPSATFLRLVHPGRGPLDFLKRFRHFLNWYFSHWKASDATVLEILELSDRVVVETETFRENFGHFLRHHHREDLLEKFFVVPHAVPDFFLGGPVSATRKNLVFCSGRWDDDQKNAHLLAACIPRILRNRPDTEFLIAGFGVEAAFHDLAVRHPEVKLAGLLAREKLPAILDDCRFLLSSSRGESHPIGALEALCRGCTVVATPLPGFQDIVRQGNCGTIATAHSPAALARAACEEMRLWDSQKRNPERIASHWRAEVNNKTVVTRLLAP